MQRLHTGLHRGMHAHPVQSARELLREDDDRHALLGVRGGDLHGGSGGWGGATVPVGLGARHGLPSARPVSRVPRSAAAQACYPPAAQACNPSCLPRRGLHAGPGTECGRGAACAWPRG
eukprot:scaffold5790_cov63-Phaeocystis_antarctica.AAC.1